MIILELIGGAVVLGLIALAIDYLINNVKLKDKANGRTTENDSTGDHGDGNSAGGTDGDIR